MFKSFQHVLPNARAWRTTTDKKLRQFFQGLGDATQDVRVFLDSVLDDLYPETSRALDEWEDQFGLPDTGLTEQQRRDRLAATWKALGGQSPRYIQDTLQANGFDVYVHQWWEPGTEPAIGSHACAVPRNPLEYLRRSQDVRAFRFTLGSPAATCGNPAVTCGSTDEPPGYPLVNKVLESHPIFINTAGNPAVTCGAPDATCGFFTEFELRQKDYVVPNDPSKWPYFLYIGGETFPELAAVPQNRRDEFENLCLKICPTQQWLGILVQYS